MSQTNGAVKSALGYLDEHYEDFKAQLVELSRIPGVSASGFPPEELRRSADAVADVLRRSGVENVRILERSHRPERRRMDPRDDQLWISLLQPIGQTLCDPGGATVEEMTVSGRLTAIAERQHQVRAVDTRRGPESVQPAQPHQWHAVWS